MKDFKIEFTDKEITTWGSMSLMQKMLDKMSFEEVLNRSHHYLIRVPIVGTVLSSCLSTFW